MKLKAVKQIINILEHFQGRDKNGDVALLSYVLLAVVTACAKAMNHCMFVYVGDGTSLKWWAPMTQPMPMRHDNRPASRGDSLTDGFASVDWPRLLQYSCAAAGAGVATWTPFVCYRAIPYTITLVHQTSIVVRSTVVLVVLLFVTVLPVASCWTATSCHWHVSTDKDWWSTMVVLRTLFWQIHSSARAKPH